MAETQTIPNFEFSGFYYFDILKDILRYLRINVPEITDESDEEAYIQLARAWSLAHHYMNVRLDLVANETLLPTARLLESVRSQLKLIDFELRQAVPSQTELVMEFSSLFVNPSTLIVPRNSQFGTEDTDEEPQIIFEADEDNYISETDRLTNVFLNPAVDITLSNKNVTLFDYVSSSVPEEGDVIIQDGNYAIIAEIIDGDTIRLNEATSIINGAAKLKTSNFSSDKSGEAFTDALTFDFGDPEPQPGDEIYFMHDSVMWDRIDFIVAQAYKTGIIGVWEFFDGSQEDENPDEITNLGSNLEFDLTTLLGEDDKSGTLVFVTYAPSATGELLASKYVGGKNIVQSTGLLGQVTPSLIENDYTVGTVWQPLAVDSNSSYDEGEFSKNGSLIYPLPQDIKQDWAKTTLNGTEGFPLRFRVQSISKKAAEFTGSDFNAIGLDSNNYNIKIGFDAYADTEVDITGDNGANPGTYTLSGIITQINTIMGGVNAALSNVASEVDGQLKFTGPDATLGKDSEIRILAPSGQDATNELLGLSESSYPYSYSGVGGKAIIDTAKIDQGKQYLLFDVAQGQTVEEAPLASSDGSPNQEYTLGFTPLIDGSLVIEVDEGSGFTAYDEVENFLNSDGAARVFSNEINADDVSKLTFGDGVNGKIPPAGVDNIRAIYRIGADQNGNVGSRTIIVNLAGISFVNRIFNPRQATGWGDKQGNTGESLQKAKIEGPASLRTLGKAITPPDMETLAVGFVSPTTEASPVSRALAIEETFGVKTIELVVVGSGGGILNETQKSELSDYFNGNKEEGIDGVLLSNHELTPVNYTPRVIDIEVESEGGNAESIKNALTALLNPNAVFDDGVTYRWDFGGLVPTSLIIAEVHDTDPVNVKKVTLITPAADIQLAARELPIAGTIQVTIV